ncbi:hypothetical protein EJK80_06150 [Corynebacterium phoceense]|uniref:Uncharacterized protein n=1 Tax=Corynebacterium phoceense TaxID=1686286 RepID=A0A540R7K0_9CORY|nr:hypothetical protein [Corynebacterium phoceense]TQE43587.1 hypothetical protein EJK80_06150 [Corynebacterium phoceense]
MTNIDRAARAIQPYEPRNGSPRDVAIDLASAGLLAPDLPEPGRAWRDDDAPLIWHVPERNDRLAATVDERPTHPTIGLEDDNRVLKHLTATEARALALALLAAANHAREHDAS